LDTGTVGAAGRSEAMPRYQLKYLSSSGAMETIEAADPDEAEALARMRLLFSEPGLAIAIVCEGSELRRITQRPRAGMLRI
jgi:hypothetical protein